MEGSRNSDSVRHLQCGRDVGCFQVLEVRQEVDHHEEIAMDDYETELIDRDVI